jgi:hypothetical protein
MMTPQKTKLFMIVNLKSHDYTLSSNLHGAVNGSGRLARFYPGEDT